MLTELRDTTKNRMSCPNHRLLYRPIPDASEAIQFAWNLCQRSYRLAPIMPNVSERLPYGVLIVPQFHSLMDRVRWDVPMWSYPESSNSPAGAHGLSSDRHTLRILCPHSWHRPTSSPLASMSLATLLLQVTLRTNLPSVGYVEQPGVTFTDIVRTLHCVRHESELVAPQGPKPYEYPPLNAESGLD